MPLNATVEGQGGNEDRIALLSELVSSKKNILILTHNNPDPDALASAFALQYIFKKKCGVDSLIVYGGIIGRAENKAMIKHLRINARPIEDIDIRHYDFLILVDSQPGAGNNPLMKSQVPSIIIDHHNPIRAKSKKAKFADIRTDYGSTSTIVTEYIQAFGVTGNDIDKKVATALLYGIKTDTRDLGRGAGPQDMKAALFLYPRALHKILAKIEHPKLLRAHFKTFGKAINHALVYKDAVVSDLERIDNTDSLAEMADWLIRLNGIKWALVLGEFRGEIYFSLRATSVRARADRIVQKMVKGLGSAGGHNMVAAGKVDQEERSDRSYEKMVELLLTRFLKGVKLTDVQPRNLL